MINRIISSITRGFNKAGYQIGNLLGELFWRLEKDPLIIVFIDGGMCSQIMRATLGKQLEEKGFRVKYQLDFYRLNGLDMYHAEERGYILDKCFPDVKINVASPKEIKKYKRLYDYESGLHGKICDIESLDRRKPLYLSGYSSDFLIEQLRCPDFFDIDSIVSVLGPCAMDYYHKILNNREHGIANIGVHVRRGDMVNTGFYWKVLTGRYFVEAIRRISTELNGRQVCLFFFSNGFDFVKSEILPEIDDIDYILVDGNDREYEDFYLFTKCDYQIKSQGGWGRMAFIYNSNPDKKLVTYEKSCAIYGNCIMIELEDDMYIH